MSATKWANDLALDALLAYLASSTILVVCSQDPATYAEMTATYDLATHVLTPGDGNGDFAIADDTSGRKLTLAAQAAITVNHAGNAAVVCLGISGTSVMTYRTTCTVQALTAGGTVTVPAFKYNVTDPT